VVPTNGSDDIFMVSNRGQALRFAEGDVRPMGRSAAGVVGMRFRDGDHLVSCDVFRPETELLVVTSEGFGKRIDPELFTAKGRGGLGVRCVRVSEARGHVAGALFVGADEEVLLISSGGVVIRTPVSAISRQGRDASGVSVMQLGPGFEVAAVAKILTSAGELVGGVTESGDIIGEPGVTVDGLPEDESGGPPPLG
jgi:DNA gyrase subunit A